MEPSIAGAPAAQRHFTHRTVAQALDALYHAALAEPVDGFPGCVIRLLVEIIGIEGAILGIGPGRPRRLRRPEPHERFLSPGIPSGCGADPGLEGVTEIWLRHAPAVCRIDCAAALPGDLPASFAAFARREGIRHLLLHGVASSAGLGWIMLYRCSEEAFGVDDGARLQELLPHIARCIVINQRSALDGLDGRRSNRSSALIDDSGAIKAADPGFVALLLQEWPAGGGNVVPRAVMAQLAAGKPFLGRAIQIEAVRSNGQLVFHARKNPGSARLTRAEQAVASRFAVGMSTKQIAAELGVSPNTVRTQLSHLYSKLDVHDKAQLAQRLMLA